VTRLTEEEKRIEIRDSVVMGDVNQHVLNAECPSCSTSNVKVMKCQEIQCGKRFCELCHPECRYSKGNSFCFDSGKGLGPFCRKCITAKRKEEERAERVVREKAEKERKREEEKRREREYLEGVERAKKERKREEEGIRKRERERVEREETAEIADKARQAENQKKAEAKRLEWESGRVERERESESSKLWKTAAIHASIQNDTHKKRLMYSLLLGVLVSILFSALIDVPIIGGDNVMSFLAVIMGTLCLFYPLYLITMIIICWLTGTKKHYVKLLKRSNIMHDYNIMVEELSLLTVAELRDKLSEVGLPVDANNKTDLITRLAEYEKMMLWKEGLL
jgi:hypothetical protein